MQLCDSRLHLKGDLSKKGERILFERLSTRRPAPKIVLRQKQKQQSDTLEGPTSAGIGKPVRKGFEPTDEKEEPKFEVDLRIDGIAQHATNHVQNNRSSK